MPRLKLEIPDFVHFSTELSLRISDINYGGHLGNDAVLSLAHEARIRLLQNFGWTELSIEETSIIMTDAIIIYKNEGFYGDTLRIDISVSEIENISCAFYYLMRHTASGKEIARVKTGISFYDYAAKKLASVPQRFSTLFTNPESKKPRT